MPLLGQFDFEPSASVRLKSRIYNGIHTWTRGFKLSCLDTAKDIEKVPNLVQGATITRDDHGYASWCGKRSLDLG